MQMSNRKAAQYIRMSTESQDLSPESQRSAIERYAMQHQIEVVKTYLDAGKSGRTLAKRPAMKQLLADVVADDCPYSIVLVYDVSRWGRFQDADASAYYEYHCRLHGIDVRYVQEPFAGTDSPLSNLFKSVKRAMAAEYSRELGVKTTAGQWLAIEKGFAVGGLPCLGLSRVAVSKVDGTERVLGPNDHKSARFEHVRWVPGLPAEVQAVRRIFETYATTELSVVDVARRLRDEGVCARDGTPITEWMLYRLLRCEALIGNFVWGREENKRPRAPDDPRVRRAVGAIEPIVSKEIYAAVQAKLARRSHVVLSRQKLLEQLRTALNANPRMAPSELKANGCCCRETYIKNFGSMRAAWEAAGEVLRGPDSEAFATMAATAKAARAICRQVIAVLRDAGVECGYYLGVDKCSQTLTINGDTILRVQVIVKRSRYGERQWSLRKVYKKHFDWAFVVRRNDDGTVLDSLLVSRKDYFALDIWLRDVLAGEWKLDHSLDDIAALFRDIRPAESERCNEAAIRSKSIQ